MLLPTFRAHAITPQRQATPPGGRRREAGMDAWGWENLRPWLGLEDEPANLAAADRDDLGQAIRELAGLRDLDAKSLRSVCEASVVAVQTLEVLTQAHDGRQVQGVE